MCACDKCVRVTYSKDNNIDATDGAVVCVCVCQSARVMGRGWGQCTSELSIMIIICCNAQDVISKNPVGKTEAVHRQ